MKKFFLAAIMTMAASCVMAQEADPVIMTINNKPVTRSEFVYSYRKNNGPDVIEHKTPEEYVELFVNYKRKVEAALDAHLDTLTSYNKEFRQYRDQQLIPGFITDADVEQEAIRIYENEKAKIGPDGLVNPMHILVKVSQNADGATMNAAKLRADSIYDALRNGADFETLAREKSQDVGSAVDGGEIGFIRRGQTLKAFEEACFSMNTGDLSQPVLSEVGYHIIKIKARKQLEPYDTLRGDVMKFIERRKIRESIARNRIKQIAESQNVSVQTVMDNRADSISAVDPEMKYLIKEYHDGLLLFEISNRDVWEKASKDVEGLNAFFKKNKKKYTWDAPRFKGISFCTRDVKDIAAVKKSVKGKKFDKWAEILRSTFNNDSILRIRVDKGVFKKGDNGLVDRNVFGVADAKIKEYKGFPNTDTFGKVIKAPEEMADVKSLVIADYQDMMEKEWLRELEQRYPVTVNKEVLATVKE